MSQFWLIRHGESTSNIGEPAAFRGAPPLSTHGRAQAQALADGWQINPTVIVASSFVRTQQSAEPLRNRYPTVPHEIWPVQEFTPLADHHYRGVRMQDRKPAFYRYFDRGNPDYVDGAGAESFREGVARAARLIGRLRQQPNCVVFTHATFLRIVYWLWLHQSEELACDGIRAFNPFQQSVPIPNCAVIHGQFRDDGLLFLSAPQ